MIRVMRAWAWGYMFNPSCFACGESQAIDRGWKIQCGSCGVKTESYVSRLGETQREIEQAGRDWDAGKFVGEAA